MLNVFLIELSPDYIAIYYFASYLIWFLFKVTTKTVFHKFRIKIPCSFGTSVQIILGVAHYEYLMCP